MITRQWGLGEKRVPSKFQIEFQQIEMDSQTESRFLFFYPISRGWQSGHQIESICANQ